MQRHISADLNDGLPVTVGILLML